MPELATFDLHVFELQYEAIQLTVRFPVAPTMEQLVTSFHDVNRVKTAVPPEAIDLLKRTPYRLPDNYSRKTMTQYCFANRSICSLKVSVKPVYNIVNESVAGEDYVFTPESPA